MNFASLSATGVAESSCLWILIVPGTGTFVKVSVTVTGSVPIVTSTVPVVVVAIRASRPPIARTPEPERILATRFAAGEIGQKPSDPDIAAIPDPATFTPLPWNKSVARFACDIHVDGEEWPYDPRTILRRQLARARDKGFDFKMGLELEYFLVQKTDDGSIALADPMDTLEKPCYDLVGLTRNLDFLTTVSSYVNELGWGNYANDHEDANGQFEQNFTYADALTSCDRAIFFRYMVHQLAEKWGRQVGRRLLATFMPKPFSHLTGNGCHFHMSLWDGDTNLFLDEDDPRGLGLSDTAYRFIGGLLEHARAYSAVTAPTVNSYKRLKLGSTS